MEATGPSGRPFPANRLRLFYFLYYGGVGAWLPFSGAYLKGLGMSGSALGLATMIGPLVAGPTALAWAAYADRFHSPSVALRIAAGGAAVALLALPFVTSPFGVGAVLFANALSAPGIVPLVDAITVEGARRSGTTSYARVRLWGSLGYVALAQLLGRLLVFRGELPGDVLVPAAVAACSVGHALTAATLPAQPSEHPRPAPGAVRALMRDRRLLLLLTASALHWAGCAPYHLVFGVFVRDLGLPSSVSGDAMGLGVLAEVGVLFAFPFIGRRLGTRPVFAIAFGATAVRWALLSQVTGAFPVIALQLLHGATFGLFWAGAIRALGEIVPPSLRATGQAIFAAVVFSAGNAVGYALAGWGYDRLGGVPPVFLAAACLEVVPLALMLSSRRA